MKNELLKKFLKTFAPDENLVKADKDLIKKYKELLPEEVISVWKKHGFGNYGYGLIKFINPDDLFIYFDLALDDRSYIPFLTDCYGNIFYYKRFEDGTDKVYVLNVECKFMDLCAYSFDHFLQRFVEDEFMDVFLRRQMFNELLVRGVLIDNNQIYVLNPPMFLGGSCDVDSIVVKDMITYYDFIFPIMVAAGIPFIE